MTKPIYTILFLGCCLLAVFVPASHAISGDEVVAYTTLVPFFHGLAQGQLFPAFLAFFHEPLFQAVQLPMIFFGVSSVFIRLPNTLATILIFFLLYKIGQLLFDKKDLYIVCLLLLYLSNGFFQILGSELNHSVFNVFLLLAAYFFLRSKYYKTYLFLLLSVFTYIDGIFSTLGFGIFWLATKRRLNFRLILCSLIAGLIFILWAGSVYFGSTISNLYSWQYQAPFSLFARGMAYSVHGFVENYHLFASHNTLPYLIFIALFSLLALATKSGKRVWILLVIPLIYFNLVKMPTVHLVNFLGLFLVTVGIGFSYFLKRFKVLKYPALLVFSLIIVLNMSTLKFFNPLTVDQDLKVAATFLRSQAHPCEEIYTNLDGYTFRVYFNHSYTNVLTSPATRFAVLQSEGNITIYQKGVAHKVNRPDNINEDFFNFDNTMTYILNCRS